MNHPRTIRAIITVDVTLPHGDETLDPAAMTAVYWEAQRRVGRAQYIPDEIGALPDTWVVTAGVQQVAPLPPAIELPTPDAAKKP